MRTARPTVIPMLYLEIVLKVGDITLATTGISTASGNITLKSGTSDGRISYCWNW